MQATFGNVLHNLPRDGSAEIVESLHACGGLKIERIISKEQASPPGFWYAHPEEERVLLRSGGAGLTLEGAAAEHIICPGDSGCTFLPIVATASNGPMAASLPQGWRRIIKSIRLNHLNHS